MLEFALAALLAAAPATPTVGDDLAAARKFARNGGEAVWRGYGGAPFGFLLIADGRETLLCEDRLPAGFTAGPPDAATRCATASRPRGGLKDDLLAAMPLFGPPSTIVMGTPAATGRSRGDWVRTILHEHFHQWQAGLPGYYARTAALGLANGDATGMWMIAYPFPYADPAVARAQAAASRALAEAVAARGTPGFRAALARYGAMRAAFRGSVTPADWRYAEFQFWQEGVARWTEVTLGKRYPDRTVRAAAIDLERTTLAQLASPDLPKAGRTFVYAYGMGEAMLLEACGNGWRAAYRATLALGPLLDTALTRCVAR